MTKIEIAGSELVVRMVGMDQMWSLKSELRIPLAHVAGAERDAEEAATWYHGLRAPGTNIPGVITAGIAVALQTIILSIAAYFFMIGRSGLRVGDRITIAGVTGDVMNVGPVRFYLRELEGAAGDLKPSGRMAIFSNAVIFQHSPLFRPLPPEKN